MDFHDLFGVASRQHGLVTAAQAAKLGFDTTAAVLWGFPHIEAETTEVSTARQRRAA
jgi:hypothetical protein